MSTAPTLADRSLELRAAFDRERAAPAASASEPKENLLAIRVGGDAYVIEVSQIANLAARKKITELPGRLVELIGLTAVRGELVPVYSLSLLLGYPADETERRWMVLTGPDNPVAFAFGDFDGYLQVSAKNRHSTDSDNSTHDCVTHVVRTAGGVRALLNISLLQTKIQERCGSSNAKER